MTRFTYIQVQATSTILDPLRIRVEYSVLKDFISKDFVNPSTQILLFSGVPKMTYADNGVHFFARVRHIRDILSFYSGVRL